MKLLKTLLMPSLILGPSPTYAAQGAASPDGDRVVCRSIAATGTRFKKRICRPDKEWRAMSEQSQGAAREIQSRPQICTGKEGC